MYARETAIHVEGVEHDIAVVELGPRRRIHHTDTRVPSPSFHVHVHAHLHIDDAHDHEHEHARRRTRIDGSVLRGRVRV